jgi:hypothetical protein
MYSLLFERAFGKLDTGWPEEDIRFLGVLWLPDLRMICLRMAFVINFLKFIPTELTISTC